MPNRIKGLDGGSIGAGSGNPIEQIRANAPVSSATGSETRPSTDSVHITDSARQLSTLAQVVQETPDINTQRVADLQQAIDGGRYSVDPARIADRMLQIEQDLGDARGG